MFGHVIHKFRYIALFLLIIFCFASNTAFALEQIRNSSFDAITGWSTYTRISGTNNYNTTVTATGGKLTITGNNTSNTGRNYDGMAYQAFTTPANATNVKFTWEAWTITNANSGFGFGNSSLTNAKYQISYNTTANNTNGTALSSSTSTNANVTVAAGNTTVTNLATNRTYYIQAYAYATLKRRTFTMSVPSISVNFSPNGLAATQNRSDGINLTWNTSTSSAVTLKGYNVYRSTTSGSGYTKINTELITGNSFLDTTANVGTNYY